jgi:hypothetical protein
MATRPFREARLATASLGVTTYREYPSVVTELGARTCAL